jgi:N-acetylneuraminic acid mutarotase
LFGFFIQAGGHMRAAAGTIKATAALLLLPLFAAAQFEPTTPLPQALMSHTAEILGGRVYVAGGFSDQGSITGSGYINNVYYCASMNPDGTLGSWQAASAMPEILGLGMHASVSHNGRLYVLGGSNFAGQRNVVYFAAPAADGTLSGWQQTVPLPLRVYAHSAAVVGNRIYVAGGIARGTGTTQLVYSAGINADGTLDAWRYETPLPAPLFGHRSFTRAGKLFVLGGFSYPALYSPGGVPATALSRAVYSAAVNGDGALGAWEQQPQLPSELAFYGMVATDNSVYLLGGFDGGVTNAVYFSPLTAAGALGSWQALQALPENLLSLAAVSTPEYLYSIGGGVSYIDAPTAGIYFSKLQEEPRAFVKLTPSTISKKSSGKWVTVIIGLPEADAGAVLPASVMISAVNGQAVTPIEPDPKWTAKLHSGDSDEFDGMGGVTYLMLKYSRSAVADIIPEGEFSIEVTGLLADGRTFVGESMNRALSSKKNFTATLEERAGVRQGPGGVKVDIPKGAFKGNPELLLTAAPEDAQAVGAEEKEKRSRGMKGRALSAVSEVFEFGPHGEVFDKPVTISLPYRAEMLPATADESALKVAYWNAQAGDWEILASEVSKEDKLVRAQTGHFSVYQVVSEAVPSAAPAPAPAFSVGEAYVFPNPAKGGARPVLHVAASGGDQCSVKVYSASGRLVHEASVSGAPGLVDGAPAYELELRGEFTSGVYYYRAEVAGSGGHVKKTGKFAVVR